MRLSVIKEDPGYHPLAVRCEVTLNGMKPIHPCHTADEEAGKLYCYGPYDAARDELTTLELTGEVKITVPDAFRATWNLDCKEGAPCTLAPS
jgi:hypothetical protein